MRRINPYKLFVGSFIPSWIECRKELTSSAKLVYARLCRYAGENGVAFPKRETIGSELGMSLGLVKACINELKKHKLIEVNQRGLNRSNEYYFLEHKWMGLELDGYSGSRPDGLQDSRQGGYQDSHIRESGEDNQSKIEVHASRPSLRKDLQPIDPIYKLTGK